MGISSYQEIKERYHFSKLALFDIRLLNRLQIAATSDEGLTKIISEEAQKNNMGDVPHLLHQATFLQFAYMCLVWLWEGAKSANLEDQLLLELGNAATRIGVEIPIPSKISGERSITDWKSTITLLRNAISHGRVEVTDTSFKFSDQKIYGRSTEAAPTYITLTWEELGMVGEAVIHAMTPIIWPAASVAAQREI